jgi:hypothetical protein
MRPNRHRKLIGLLLTWMTIWPGVLVTGESTPPQTQASGITLRLDLSTLHHLELLEASEDSWSLRSTGSDPYVTLEPLPLAAKGSKQVVLSFETFCPQGLDDLELFFGPPIVASQSMSVGPQIKSEAWMPVAIDLPFESDQRWDGTRHRLLRLDPGRQEGVRWQIRKLKLREATAEEETQRQEAEAARRLKQGVSEAIDAFYRTPKTWQLTSVKRLADGIQLSGVGSSQIALAPCWVEIPFHWNPSQEIEPLQWGRLHVDEEGIWQQILPNTQDHESSLLSRWAVATKQHERWALLTHPCYAEPIPTPSASRLKPVTSQTRKGMGGVWSNEILDELVELGVGHITVNILLNRLISSQAHEGWPTFTHGKQTWSISPSQSDQLDRLIRFASQHQMVVSAILLIAWDESEVGQAMRHPEAQRAGHYVMPNLTQAHGIAAYGAAIDWLTRRYAQPGDPFGRISNWILHNEIDYGWVWTNMGQQPMETYLDHYHRSMRLVHLMARRHNPHARVFVSLTHHWHKESDSTWKTYAPQDMLRWLAMTSKAEGDFEWGVAYHPYPQNLFEPRMWLDDQPTSDPDTPVITMKNLEVLIDFMQQPAMKYEPQHVRGLILSEQGFHAPASSAQAQAIQSAALLYTWHKMHGMDAIEAFHLHRWVDHPQEGGLMLGLRSLPEKGFPYGRKKAAWEVFKDLETPRQKRHEPEAAKLIGVPSLDSLNLKAEVSP